MKVSSGAALATLTIATSELSADALLQLVTKAASSLQLTVNTVKKVGSLSLELISGKVLTQRNAIIRCLCGMGLHNALDDSLMGGHGKTANASPTHAMAIASISSWMSVADHVSKKKNDDEGQKEVDSLLNQLQSHLGTRSFLIPSATCTIADVDVAMSIVAKKKSSMEDIASYHPNVHRWLVTVSAFLAEHDIKLPATIDPIPNSHGLPIFFYGNEENIILPKKPTIKSKEGDGAGGKAADSKGKQQDAGAGAGEGKKAKKEKQKKEGKGKQQQQQAAAAADIDISALDIRVGKIVKVWEHPEAEKLYCEEIDVGEESGPRQIASGLRPFYKSADELNGQLVMVLCNLKKRNLVGFPSHGMVMCASNPEHTEVEIMSPPENSKVGERIVFDGYETGEPRPENQVAKKKIFEKLAPDLKTNDDGVCVWKNAVGKTSIGPVKASKGMVNGQVA